MPSETLFLLIPLVFLLAGTIKGTVGIGLPTVSVGLMSQFMPPHSAIALVIFPMLISNAWQVYRAKTGLATFRSYWRLIICLVICLWITTFFAAQAPGDVLLVAIGLAIVIFAASSLIGEPPRLKDTFDAPAQIITGVSAGILGGFTSIWAPPIVTYLLARRTAPEDFIRATGLLIFLGAIPLIIGYWQAGILDGPAARTSLVMIIPTLIGFSIGEVLRRRLSGPAFRKALLWMFLLMGLNLLRRAFF